MLPQHKRGSAKLWQSNFSKIGLIRARIAIMAADMARFSLRLVKRGATTLPGKIALAIKPQLLAMLTAGRQVILVTGTNGKTTTVSILTSLLTHQGYKVVTNASGANLTSGLTAALIEQKKVLQVQDQQSLVLVLEIDEAFFAKLAGVLNPTHCLVTNFFQDQLDRYGRLEDVHRLIASGLDQTKADLILCAEDPLCVSLSKKRNHQSLFFGLALEKTEQLNEAFNKDTILESSFCPLCGHHIQYKALVYAHLGDFYCPSCGFARPQPQLEVAIKSLDRQGQVLTATYKEPAEQTQMQRLTSKFTLDGLHNAYNAAGALLVATLLTQDFAGSVSGLSQVSSTFGRMERFKIEDKEVCMILVKNPVGLERALDYVIKAADYGGCMLAFNNNESDGRDISWIWDVDFAVYMPAGQIGLAGNKKMELAVRLLYADKKAEDLCYQGDDLAILQRCLHNSSADKCLYLLPNYTAMLAIRADLARKYKLKIFGN